MIKSIVHQLNVSIFAELAMVLFLLVFVAVVLRTLFTKSAITEQQSKIVLNDGLPDKSKS